MVQKTFSQGPLCRNVLESYNETVIKHIPQGHGGDPLSWRVSDLIKSRITERELQRFYKTLLEITLNILKPVRTTVRTT